MPQRPWPGFIVTLLLAAIASTSPKEPPASTSRAAGSFPVW